MARSARAVGFGSFWTAETVGPEAFASLAAVAAAVPGPGPGHRGARPAAPHPDARRHGRRHPPGARPRTATSCWASASPRRSSSAGGTARPTATGPWPRPASTWSSPRRACPATPSASTATSTGAPSSAWASGSASAAPSSCSGALNERMLRLAGELRRRRAAQLPARLRRAVVRRAGPRRRGRGGTPERLVHRVRLRARRRVRPRRGPGRRRRRDLFSYAVVDAYARAFERAGFGDEVADAAGRPARRATATAPSRPSRTGWSTPSTSAATPPTWPRRCASTATPGWRSR